MRVLTVTLIASFLLGCHSTPPRPNRELSQLISDRAADDKARADEGRQFLARLLESAKAKVDRSAETGTRPTIDMLIISGGGDWGAFGTGVLKGWGKVQGDLARPEFDVVTGVSTGALIAPFAFLGDDASIEAINHLYRNPRKEWVKSRGKLYFWPSNPSFFTLPGLEEDLEKQIDQAMLSRIAAAGAKGRSLFVNTTNADYGDMHAWDLVAESNRAITEKSEERFCTILLASAGIPGIFPSRDISQCLYVDGAITGNVLYGGRQRESDTLPAMWQAAYPGTPIPRIRYWVIFNNQLRFPPQVIPCRWPDIIGRASNISMQSATVNSFRHLYAIAEISRLKRGADVEVRVISVPDDWVPPEPGVFKKSVMNELSDIGQRLGADPSSWRTESP